MTEQLDRQELENFKRQLCYLKGQTESLIRQVDTMLKKPVEKNFQEGLDKSSIKRL